MNESGTGAAFHERSNLVCLVTTALIFPPVLFFAFRDPTPGRLLGLLVLAVILQVAALIVAHIALAVVTRPEPDDERIRAIAERSDRVSGLVLSAGVFGVVALTIAQGFAGSDAGSFASPVLTGCVLCACLAVSELTRMAHAAVLHRRA